jgi:hypothetical protein
MYGLPRDFDGAFFVGRELEAVTFTANSLILAFDDSVTLTVESSYQCEWNDGTSAAEFQRVPISSSRIMVLVGRKIISVAVEDGATLSLTFDNLAVLRCFDDRPAYECYRIAHGGNEIYV